MSARFYEEGEGEEKVYFFGQDELTLRLDEENLFANLHEVMHSDHSIEGTADAVYDRVAVLDPRDDTWYMWWRYDHGDETFNKMEFVARHVGTCLIRQTVMPNVQDMFMQAHSFDTNDFDQLLGVHDGTTDGEG